MKKILIATAFIIFCCRGLSQNIGMTKNNNEELHYPNFQLIKTDNFQVNFFSKNSRPVFFDWKKNWNQHPTRKIIIGSVCILLGTEGIVEAFTPSTNYGDPSNNKITQIKMISGSVIFLSSGTLLLIRGINLKRQNKLKVTTSRNGIVLIYRI